MLSGASPHNMNKRWLWNTYAPIRWTPLSRKWMETAKTWNVSNSQGHNSVKYSSIYHNNQAWPTYSYTKFVYQISFLYVQHLRRKGMATANNWNNSKFNVVHNSVKNLLNVPKIELYMYLHILMIYLYTKFHFRMCTLYKEIKWNC